MLENDKYGKKYTLGLIKINNEDLQHCCDGVATMYCYDVHIITQIKSTLRPRNYQQSGTASRATVASRVGQSTSSTKYLKYFSLLQVCKYYFKYFKIINKKLCH